jgi:hypothetical protein
MSVVEITPLPVGGAGYDLISLAMYLDDLDGGKARRVRGCGGGAMHLGIASSPYPINWGGGAVVCIANAIFLVAGAGDDDDATSS